MSSAADMKTVTVYKVRKGFRLSEKEAQVVGQRIEHLGKGDFCSVTADEFLQDAQHKSSPTYQLFAKKELWDDKKAAHIARLEYARYLLRAVEVEVITPRKKKTVKATVVTTHPTSKGKDKKERRAYGATIELMKDPDQKAQILEEARYSMQAWIKRYENYAWLARLTKRAKIILEEMEDLEV